MRSSYSLFLRLEAQGQVTQASLAGRERGLKIPGIFENKLETTCEGAR